MAKGLNISKANQGRQVRRLTGRARILAPPEYQRVAMLQGIITAVISQPEPELQVAAGYYDTKLVPMAEGVLARGGEVPDIPKAVREATLIEVVSDFARGVDLLLTDGDRQLIADFADKWLLGNPLASKVLTWGAFCDAMGIRPPEVEDAAEFVNEEWQKETHKRERERHLQDIRSWLKDHHDGHQLDYDAVMNRATVWVRAHHLHNSLQRALREIYGHGLDLYIYRKWQGWLKPFDEAIGWQRKPGPWPQP